MAALRSADGLFQTVDPGQTVSCVFQAPSASAEEVDYLLTAEGHYLHLDAAARTQQGTSSVVANDQGLTIQQPAPGSGRTMISFGLAEASNVSLAIDSAAGRLVASLADGPMEKGSHSITWNGTDGNGRAVPPGVYFVHMKTSSNVQTDESLCSGRPGRSRRR